jgi:hypothetical protein
VRRQGESLDAAAGTYAAAQNVVGVKIITTLQVLPVQISKMLVGGLVATMTVRNDDLRPSVATTKSLEE